MEVFRLHTKCDKDELCMSRRLAGLLIGLLTISAVEAIAVEKPWVEVNSPHFRVLTDGTPADARHVAGEFEQLRYVFASQFPNFRLESGAPLTVFAARDEGTAKLLEPHIWQTKGPKPAGIFHHSREKQYVMVRLDTWGQGAHEVVYHEFAHSILHLNSHWLPTWLDEGMAEFFAYTRFEQHDIYVGAPSERYRTLLGGPLFPVEDLLAGPAQYSHDERKVQMFYAESWALVHFLTFGPSMENGKRLNQFYQAIQQGTEQKKAFQQVFGDFKAIDKQLDEYTRKFTHTAFRIPDSAKIEEKGFAVRTLTMAETEAEIAGYYFSVHGPGPARPLVDQALKDDPKLGLAHEEKGFVLFFFGDDSAAASEFSQAFALDNTLYLSLFFKTMLSPIATSDTPADQNAFYAALLQVLRLNLQFAPAYVQLARLDVREGKLADALGVSRKAEQLEPSRAGYHILTGQILLRMGKGRDAADFAKYVADRWPGADHNEAVELWNNVPAEQRPADGQPEEMTSKNIQTVSGTVRSVRCGENFELVINRDGHPLTFHRKGGFPIGFADTLWYRGDSNLCHHCEGTRAVVHYHASTDASYTGDLAEVDIRDDLPSPTMKPAEKNASSTKP